MGSLRQKILQQGTISARFLSTCLEETQDPIKVACQKTAIVDTRGTQ